MTQHGWLQAAEQRELFQSNTSWPAQGTAFTPAAQNQPFQVLPDFILEALAAQNQSFPEAVLDPSLPLNSCTTSLHPTWEGLTHQLLLLQLTHQRHNTVRPQQGKDRSCWHT